MTPIAIYNCAQCGLLSIDLLREELIENSTPQ
jgi:hypothetical protein